MAQAIDGQNGVRRDMADEFRRLLIGPLESGELLIGLAPGIDPADFYLTGLLWPIDEPIGPAEDDGKDAAASTGSETSGDEGTPLSSIFKPSSIGLTCAIAGETTPFEIRVRAARYIKSAGPVAEGQASFNWQHKPVVYRVLVEGGEKREVWKTNRFILENGNAIDDPEILVHIRRRVRDRQLVVTATLINLTKREQGERPGPCCLYQTSLSVITSAPVIEARNAGLHSPDDELRGGDLLFRDAREFAVGHGVGTTWPAEKEGRVDRVSTDWMPEHYVRGVTRGGHLSLQPLIMRDKSVLNAATLADSAGRDATIAGLREFAEAYTAWIKSRRDTIGNLAPTFQPTATSHMDECGKALHRILDGIELLKKNDAAWLAFCLANQAMENYFHSPVREKRGPLRWAPFQLAFMLLTLRSIAEGDHPDRQILDLLWFPTGGGKTEAYLGLVLYTIFLRRLTNPASHSIGHVDVLMRYTLRLLTVQQFQRAASVICRAELLRASRADLGDTRISIGLFVGMDATPNTLVNGESSAEALLKAEADGQRPKSTPRLILRCPLCNADLPVSAYRLDTLAPALHIVCPAGPACPSNGKPLPVYTVDEDIYRVRPSLLIGTVDKFAQLPRKEEVGLLLGRPAGLPPELIIQDELHLISGPLGTMTGLYEAVVDLLCTRSGIIPKIIGSTATIGGAGRQVRALFDRGLMQFPPPGLESKDSFFAVRDDSGPDRLYLGLSTSGRSPKFTLQAAAAALLQTAQWLHDQGRGDGAVDPWWTLLLYFNSLRELGGAKVMMRDDVRRTMRFYKSRTGSSERAMELEEPLELTSRVPSSQIPEYLQRLNRPLGGDPFEGQPVDSVLASNMISVGVDIPRLGLMLVNGQPKTTAEYIQSTSRVGRGLPGLVITIYNAGRPRDMSHYEHFRQYHETLYRRVELMSVTPWSARARDRALHAVLAAGVRHLQPGMGARMAAVDFKSELMAVELIAKFLRQRAESSGMPQGVGEDVENELSCLVAEWEARARKYRDANATLEYWARFSPHRNKLVGPHLMRGAEDPVTAEGVWRTPNSMREVEPQTYYVLWPENGGK